IAGITGVDTRRLARHIRDKGTCKGLITQGSTPNLVGLARLHSTLLPTNQVQQVSTKTSWVSPAEKTKYHVVAVDCGIKHNIIRSLNQRNCDVTIVPWNTTAENVEQLHPDGIFLSNGPGNPEDVTPVMELVRQLRGKYPIFGICLGHQIIALSYGAKTYKLKFGHRGGNHPVKNLITGKVEITSQNHSYAVDTESLAGNGLEITHINLLDQTVEGLCCEKDHVFCVQYHPESAPGPQDSSYLFDEFIRRMEECSHA
ncbi:MAG: glutamine-hydrolyzing carbamoyl-phosphate synthase small subunit, partial [Oscillospiraceae bacterium]|nr:glutamine-hydrolyzing carbamoyl-phosphate synthase small subunit [Oscillospiraceae bacterium]